MQRRQLAIGGLLVFLTGTLIMPAMHKLGLARGEDCAAHAACACCGRAAHERPEASREPGEESSSNRKHPAPHKHDPSTCSICQLAAMPATAPVVTLAVPQAQFCGVMALVPTAEPDTKPLRLRPFARGPPA